MPMFSLDLKGRFYATLAVLYITGRFYAGILADIHLSIEPMTVQHKEILCQPR